MILFIIWLFFFTNFVGRWICKKYQWQNITQSPVGFKILIMKIFYSSVRVSHLTSIHLVFYVYLWDVFYIAGFPLLVTSVYIACHFAMPDTVLTMRKWVHKFLLDNLVNSAFPMPYAPQRIWRHNDVLYLLFYYTQTHLKKHPNLFLTYFIASKNYSLQKWEL